MLPFLKKQLSWILLAIGLSTIMWGIVTNQLNPEVSDVFQGIPVRVDNLPAGLVVRGEVQGVDVRIVAPQDVMKRLTRNEIQAYVDASKAGPGIQELPVRAEVAYFQAHVDDTQPSKVAVQLSVVKKKDIPVKVNLLGNVPFGYTQKLPRVAPEQVTVSGPEDAVKAAVAAVIDIRLDGVTSSISQLFKPVPQDGYGGDVKDVSLNPESVLVEMPIEREVGYKTVPIVPQVVGVPALGYQVVGVMSDPTSITVVGDPKALDGLSFLTTTPIDVTGASRDMTTNAEPSLPSGVSLARKQSVVVRLYINPIEGSEILRVAPTIKGLRDGLQATIAPSAIDVTLSGLMPVLSSTKPQDIQIVIDATGLTAGKYTVSPKVIPPPALKVGQIRPDKVELTIR
ncbi:MAG: CdaR family protein [Chloroflexi bacterium]|nr:CdaR family protein [Chloroflexota bacterium]